MMPLVKRGKGLEREGKKNFKRKARMDWRKLFAGGRTKESKTIRQVRTNGKRDQAAARGRSTQKEGTKWKREAKGRWTIGTETPLTGNTNGKFSDKMSKSHGGGGKVKRGNGDEKFEPVMASFIEVERQWAVRWR